MISRIIWIIYRLARFFYALKIKPLSICFTLLNRLLFSISISPSAIIDKSVRFHYQGLGIVIGGSTVIMEKCEISQHVTLGGRFSAGKTFKRQGYPVIGKNTFIGPNTVVIGPVDIGNDVIVGPNSTVINDLEKESIYVGAPAKKVRSIRKRLEGDKYEM